MAAISASASVSGLFPFGLEVDGPQPQNRLSVLLRIIYAIPHLIVLYLLNAVLGIVAFIAWLVILITGKYPGGMMNFAIGGLRWETRVGGYLWLLTDKYPPFSLEEDAAYPVRFVGAGQVDGRNRLTCFFRILMIIPHLIVLYVLGIIAEIAIFIGWIVALITGSVPEGIHNFAAGVLRWAVRMQAYYWLLTDEYPPFSMS